MNIFFFSLPNGQYYIGTSAIPLRPTGTSHGKALSPRCWEPRFETLHLSVFDPPHGDALYLVTASADY